MRADALCHSRLCDLKCSHSRRGEPAVRARRTCMGSQTRATTTCAQLSEVLTLACQAEARHALRPTGGSRPACVAGTRRIQRAGADRACGWRVREGRVASGGAWPLPGCGVATRCGQARVAGAARASCTRCALAGCARPNGSDVVPLRTGSRRFGGYQPVSMSTSQPPLWW